MKARCPHRHPWYVECFECASEVVIERLGIGKKTIEKGDGWIRETWTAYYDPKIYQRLPPPPAVYGGPQRPKPGQRYG